MANRKNIKSFKSDKQTDQRLEELMAWPEWEPGENRSETIRLAIAIAHKFMESMNKREQGAATVQFVVLMVGVALLVSCLLVGMLAIAIRS